RRQSAPIHDKRESMFTARILQGAHLAALTHPRAALYSALAPGLRPGGAGVCWETRLVGRLRPALRGGGAAGGGSRDGARGGVLAGAAVGRRDWPGRPGCARPLPRRMTDAACRESEDRNA